MRGRVALSIFFFLGLCGSAWFNVQQHTQSVQDKKALSDKLATLKNQVQQQPVASPSPSSDPADAPLLAGQSRVSLAVFGASIVVVDPISDLVYGPMKYSGNDAIGFTTQSLLAKYPECQAGALGTLVRTKVSSSPKPSPTPSSSFRTPSNQPFNKYLGGYLYTYRPTYSVCADDKAGEDALAAEIDALKNQALPTLSLAKPGSNPSPGAGPSSSPGPN